jgi:hypothetical protein
MKVYLVGRESSAGGCDIALPAGEPSVSRRHLELQVHDDGRAFLVHLHPVNRTLVLRGGDWEGLKQDYVGWDEPLALGEFRTTARELLARAGPARARQEAAPEPQREEPMRREMEWDPERGTFKRPGGGH